MQSSQKIQNTAEVTAGLRVIWDQSRGRGRKRLELICNVVGDSLELICGERVVTGDQIRPLDKIRTTNVSIARKALGLLADDKRVVRLVEIPREVRAALALKGTSFRQYTNDKDWSPSLARDVAAGVISGKTGTSKLIMDELKKDFPEVYGASK